jgi:hypothetical protein
MTTGRMTHESTSQEVPRACINTKEKSDTIRKENASSENSGIIKTKYQDFQYNKKYKHQVQ